jgi:protein TonB
MNFACAFRKLVFIILMLAISTSMARAQAPASKRPDRNHIELEVKPPDEPSSSSTPEAEIVPDATSSMGATPPQTGPEGEISGPPAADTVAHPPEIVTYVVPEYPRKARAQKVAGRVLLMVIIDESGKVEDDVKIVDSIPMLDQAALDAIHQWRFEPARDADGNPVRVQLAVPVRFSLK